MGIAVRSGSPVNLSIAPPVWKQLVGMPLTLTDLSEIDSDYVQGLLYIRDNPEAFIGIEFTAPSSSGNEVRLHQSWTHVTMENSAEYVRLSTHLRLHEFDSQIQDPRPSPLSLHWARARDDGVWKPRDFHRTSQICDDIQGGGANCPPGPVVLGRHGEFQPKREITVPEVCLGPH